MRVICSLIVLFVVPLGLWAQPVVEASNPQPLRLTLSQALEIAQSNNPTLGIARAKAKAALGIAIDKAAFPNPELELTAEEWPVSGGRGFRDAKQTVGIAQRVPWPGKRGLDIQAGRQTTLARDRSAEALARDLQRDVTESFLRALALRAKLEAAGDLLRVAQDISANLKRKMEAGAVPEQESLRAEVECNQIEKDRGDLRLELEAEQTTLSGLLGLTPAIADPLGELPQAANADPAPRQLEGWLAAHPAMLAAEADLRAAELRSSRARLEAFPDVTLGVAGGAEGPDRTSIVEFRMTIPLPLFDRKRGQKLAAEADAEQARLEMEVTRRQLMRTHTLARSRAMAAAARAEALGRITLPKAREALRLVRTGFEEGKFTIADLLDTQRTLTRVVIDYQDKLLEMNLAMADLASLAGKQFTPFQSDKIAPTDRTD